MLHLQVDIESIKIQYQPVNAMLLMKGVANEYSSSYGIIYGHLLLLANNLLGNNVKSRPLCRYYEITLSTLNQK